ncbi:MAG: GtrA family protein [Phreatobacter sp.]|uniref:GtrA family protein n=1 Tax=Phreatobacter sp. TaxID=1966341 RepID=UPI0027344858|nr:GtrA family protein [Phreatobacter sp.]MDP2801312.1 GtrA family protein [Phreatobacter sp.]
MRRIVTFAAVGVVNTLVDIMAFLLLTRWFGVAALLANVASFSLGAANSYVLNRLVTFPDAAAPLGSAGTILRFAAVTLVALGMSSATLAAGLALSLDDIAAKAASIAATFAGCFVLNRYVVFRPVRPSVNR